MCSRGAILLLAMKRGSRYAGFGTCSTTRSAGKGWWAAAVEERRSAAAAAVALLVIAFDEADYPEALHRHHRHQLEWQAG
jgi:hypothetical protein